MTAQFMMLLVFVALAFYVMGEAGRRGR